MGVLAVLPIVCLFIGASVTWALPDRTCTYNNQVYRPGDTWPRGDGCNNCTCHYSCTRCLCTDLLGRRSTKIGARNIVNRRMFTTTSNNNNNNNNNNNVNVNTNYVYTSTVIVVHNSVTCSANGAVYGLAQGYRGSDGCTVCTCTTSGIVCSSWNCPHHQTTSQDHHKCRYGGSTYNFADTFPHQDGCNQCVCASINVQCTDAPACKPQPTGCLYDGRQYQSGDSFSHADGCNQCQCTLFGVMCTSGTCTTTTTLPPFTCKWNHGYYRDGEGNIPAGDGCNTCTCQSGRVSCTATLSCP